LLVLLSRIYQIYLEIYLKLNNIYSLCKSTISIPSVHDSNGYELPTRFWIVSPDPENKPISGPDFPDFRIFLYRDPN